MKLVKCIVRTHKADETTDALRQIDVSGVVVSQVKGRGRQTNPSVSYRCIEYRPRYRAQMMIVIQGDEPPLRPVRRKRGRVVPRAL